LATLSSLTVRGDSATITLLSDPAIAPFGQPNCGTTFSRIAVSLTESPLVNLPRSLAVLGGTSLVIDCVTGISITRIVTDLAAAASEEPADSATTSDVAARSTAALGTDRS
jgi:hypothetical protein